MNKTAVYLVLTLLLASTMPLSVHADQSEDIPTNASETGAHNTLVAALQQVNLDVTLSGTDHSRCSHQQTQLSQMLALI